MKNQARKEILNSIVKRAKQFTKGHKHKKTLNKIIEKVLINYILKKSTKNR